MNVDTGVETIISDVPGVEEHRGAWSPDASRIAFHLGDKIAVVNTDGTGLITLPDKLSAGPIGWSPDGSRIYGNSQGGLTRWSPSMPSAKHLPDRCAIQRHGSRRLQLAANRAVDPSTPTH